MAADKPHGPCESEGWTVGTLHEHIIRLLDEREQLSIERAGRLSERIDSMKEQTRLAFASSEKAIEKSESAQKDYNLRSNEFRSALDDAQKNSVSVSRFDDFKKEYESYKNSQHNEIRSLRESRSEVSGRRDGISVAWAVLIGISGLLFGSVGVIVLMKNFVK